MSKEISRRGIIAAQQKVPTRPQNVSATAGDAQAHIIWDAPASSGTSAINNYEVTVSPTTGVSGGTVRYVGSSVTGLTFTGLSNGVSYSFTVRAMNAIGSSSASAPSNSIIPGAVGPPDTPPNLAVTVSDGTAIHTFDEVSNATTYRIQTELVA